MTVNLFNGEPEL